MKRQRASRFWDMVAAGLSSACIIHCLGLPLLVTLLPLASQLGDSPTVHLVLVSLAAPVTLWVVWSEGLALGGGLFAATALTGLALMLAAVLIPWLEAFETPVTLAGGSLLGGAHIWRWLHHQDSADPHTHSSD